ncbi:hypothetical protein [Novosphingobium sp. JCM 18896]|uniref:hypothetical protein n=1 Tax=Novosphingobium sp. JCM 18896 TaxID=2989731 RepID=UPI002221A269|nr:hypothetical protein [Novosphingobium sp. JCM 18896]MCW1428063.1 hypothetical protein [Novosphingobium sp. JCM 18896]
MAKALAQFSIKRTGEDYRITLEDEDGGTSVWTADEDALDLIIDAIESVDDEDEEEVDPDGDEDEDDD